MAEVNISQAEADALLLMEKHRVDDEEREYPITGGRLIVPLSSPDKREEFVLDIYRGRISLEKQTFQNRARQMIVLARLDVGGSPHRNPDGEEIGCPHLHLYREDYGDKWAHAVDEQAFTNLSDPQIVLDDFLRYCNVTDPPVFYWGLFK